MECIIVEEVRQVILEVPDDFDLDNLSNTVLDMYRKGCVSAKSKPVYLNYESQQDGEWKTIWLSNKNDTNPLKTVHPEDPAVIPVRINVYPHEPVTASLMEDVLDDVDKRMRSCDGDQDLDLCNWEPMEYDREVTELSNPETTKR